MRELSPSLIRKRNKGEVPGVWRKVFLEELGIELGEEPGDFSAWTNKGRCGTETNVSSLEGHDEKLYAGCSYPVSGHVWRFNNINYWADMGNPSSPTSGDIQGLLSSNDELYAGTIYGKMRRFISPDNWENCGTTYPIMILFEQNGDVCAGVGTIPGRIMRWNGGTSWSEIGRLGGNAVMCVHLHTDGKWYGGCSNSGHLWRDDGVLNWTDLGQVDTNVNGIYSLATHNGVLYIGTEMSVVYEDRIYKYNGPSDYTYCGYPGESNIIRCMIDYNDSLLVGTNDRACVYIYRDGTVWENLSGRLDNETSLWAFKEYDGKVYVGTKPHGQVWSSECELIPITERIEITDYIADIGKAEQRIEDRFNEFMPTTTTFTVTDHWNQDHHFFTQGETDGLFDKLLKATIKGYRVIIQEGIEGESDEITSFDGELDIESIERIDRNRIEFTVTGWLRDANRYDASIVADKDNPPFSKVTGVTVDYEEGEIYGTPGGKNIEISGETGEGAGTKKWLSYCGGRKGFVYKYSEGIQKLILYEPNYRGGIYLKVDYSATPDTSAKDYFSVKEEGGALLACGWWQNRSIDFLVNKLLDHWWGEGVGTRDIKVEEIGGGVQQKMFIYLPPIYETGERDDVKITTSKVIDYNDIAKEITMLVAVEWKIETNNKLYKVVFNVETQERTVLEIWGVPSLSRITGIYETGGRWWVLVGRKRLGIIEKEEWYATHFLRLNLLLTGIEVTRDIPYNHYLPNVYHYNLYSFTGDKLSNDFYCIRQEEEPWKIYTIKCYRYDIVLNTWNNNGIMYDYAYAYNRGTWAKLDGGTQMYYYYACKKQMPNRILDLVYSGYYDCEPSDIGKPILGASTGDTGILVEYDNINRIWNVRPDNKNDLFDEAEYVSVQGGSGRGTMAGPSNPSTTYSIDETNLYVMAYLLTSSLNYEIKIISSVTETTVSDFHWNQRASGSPNFVFFKIQDHSAYWLYKTNCVSVPNGYQVRFFGSNEEDDDIYTSWQSLGGQWRIMFFYGGTYQGGNVQSEDILRSDYVGNIDNPRIFKINSTGDYFYCGFVTDKSNRIIPFLYVMGTKIACTINEFETTDWSIKDAFGFLAEGYLCYVYVPEKRKIRFYFRKKYGGTITLDDYKKNPRMKIWRYWADGIHIENSKYGLSEKRGDTFYKSKVFHVDNRLTSENSIMLVADWHYDFLCIDGRRKDFEVDVPFLIEAEPMDKVILYLYDKDNFVWWIKETIIYEASHTPWPRKSDSLIVNLKLLEIEGGGAIHEAIGERRGGIV